MRGRGEVVFGENVSYWTPYNLTEGNVAMPEQQQELGGPGTSLVEAAAPRMPTRGLGSGVGLLRLIAPVDEIIKVQQETRSLLHHALKEGRDYGVIPGTGKEDDRSKRTLFKPGAERINAAFGVVATYKIMESEINHDRSNEWEKQKWSWHPEIRGRKVYHVEASGVSRGLYRHVIVCELHKDGVMVGQGLGSCSTMETKYVDRPRDLENTVLKMAKKRAFIDATLTTFGLSDEFTQDFDEDEDVVITPPASEKREQQAARAQSKVSGQVEQAKGKVQEATQRLNEIQGQRTQKRPPSQQDIEKADELCQRIQLIWDDVALPNDQRMDDARVALIGQDVPRLENGVPNIEELGPEPMQIILEYVRGKHVKPRPPVTPAAANAEPAPAGPKMLSMRKVGKVIHIIDEEKGKECVGCRELMTGQKPAAASAITKDYCKDALKAVEREYTAERLPVELQQAMLGMADLPF